MFEEVNGQKSSTPGAASENKDNKETEAIKNQPETGAPQGETTVQDIFANVDKASPKAPGDSQAFGTINNVPEMASNNQGTGQISAKPRSKVLPIVIILVVLVIIAAGALIYVQKSRQATVTVDIPSSIVNVEEADVDTSTPASNPENGEELMEIATSEPVIINEPTGEVTPTDEASLETDGSNNSEEVVPEEPEISETVETEESLPSDEVVNLDSDQDGLSDADELNVYGTNPLKSDTDGDGYLDGEEVKNGYNPLGEGRLSQ